ncbi:MAG: hypothetical protein ACXWRE_14565 [Pseudobdellovibrionaceae bacterium]
MGKIFIVLCLLFGSAAFASGKGYTLNMKLSLNEKIVSSPRIIVLDGEAGSVTQENSSEKIFVEVVATEKTIQDHQGILMNINFGYIGKDGKQRTIISKAQIITEENVISEVSEGVGRDTLSLSIVANRIDL